MIKESLLYIMYTEEKFNILLFNIFILLRDFIKFEKFLISKSYRMIKESLIKMRRLKVVYRKLKKKRRCQYG